MEERAVSPLCLSGLGRAWALLPPSCPSPPSLCTGPGLLLALLHIRSNRTGHKREKETNEVLVVAVIRFKCGFAGLSYQEATLNRNQGWGHRKINE